MAESNDVYTHTQWINADQQHKVEAMFRGLQNKAQRNQLPEPTLEFTGAEKVFNIPMIVDNAQLKGITVPVLKKEAKITGQIPRKNGYTFLAKIDHDTDENGNSLNLVVTPNKEADSALMATGTDYHVCTANCDHCDTARARKTTFLVINEEQNKITQVGSSCVDEFVGKSTLSGLVASFNILSSIAHTDYWDELDREYAANPRLLNSYPIDSFLVLANYLTQKYGFIKSNQMNSTRDELRHFISNVSKAPPSLQDLINKAFTADRDTPEYVQAREMIQLFKDMPSENNYVKNMQNIMSRDYFELRNNLSCGMLASVPAAFIKLKLESSVDYKKPTNEAFGIKKQRGLLKLTVTNIKENYDAEFPNVKYSMKDDEGRSFSWKTSAPGKEELLMGGSFIMKATIKDHTFFRDTHYTLLSRCSDFEAVDKDFPVPEFESTGKPAKKKAFKENIEVGFTLQSHAHGINGIGHLHIQRQWKEDRKVRRFDVTLPLPLKPDYKKQIVTLLSNEADVIRFNEGVADTENPLDKMFFDQVREAARPFENNHVLGNASLFLVEDAFSPLLEHSHAEKWGNPFSSSVEIAKRKPQIFLTQAQAVHHGRSLTSGRMLELKMREWEPLIVPASIMRGDLNTLNTLKQRAIDIGKNAIIYVWEDGEISKAEPLGWDSTKIGNMFDIVKQTPVHEKISQSQARSFLGQKLITLTGIDQPEHAEALKDAFKVSASFTHCVESGIVPDIFSNTSPARGGQKGNVTLANVFANNSLILASGTNKIMVVTDTVSSYYLKAFGADVTEFNVGGSPSSQLPNNNAEVITAPINPNVDDCYKLIENVKLSMNSELERPAKLTL